LDLTGFVQRSRQPQEDSPDAHFEVLFPRADGGEPRQLIHRQAKFSGDSRHFVKNVEQPPVGLIEVLAETVNCDDHPVSVATVTVLKRWLGLTDNRFLKLIDAFAGEAGELGGHTQLISALITHNPRQQRLSLASKHGRQ
jgi:hypothetical protein